LSGGRQAASWCQPVSSHLLRGRGRDRARVSATPNPNPNPNPYPNPNPDPSPRCAATEAAGGDPRPTGRLRAWLAAIATPPRAPAAARAPARVRARVGVGVRARARASVRVRARARVRLERLLRSQRRVGVLGIGRGRHLDRVRLGVRVLGLGC